MDLSTWEALTDAFKTNVKNQDIQTWIPTSNLAPRNVRNNGCIQKSYAEIDSLTELYQNWLTHVNKVH